MASNQDNIRRRCMRFAKQGLKKGAHTDRFKPAWRLEPKPFFPDFCFCLSSASAASLFRCVTRYASATTTAMTAGERRGASRVSYCGYGKHARDDYHNMTGTTAYR